MKGKSRQGRGGEAMMEGLMKDRADGPENTKITLSFPLSAALPAALTVHNHRPCSTTSSPSPRRRHSSKGSNDGSEWKLDTAATEKRRHFKHHRRDSSTSSSSSSSPMDLTALVIKDTKSPPPLFKTGLESQFHRFTPRSSNGPMGGFPGEGPRLTNGTASPSETAQILFNLSTVAYQGRGTDRKDKTGKQGGRLGSPQVGPNLHPPTLHLPPPLPQSSESFIPLPPAHTSSNPPDGPKPELICGVCHRLFSSASSLTAHMRLHRGGRGLSCQHCGKAFIHNKRLQSHEASCRHAMTMVLSSSLPLLPILPKEEPLEEGEVRVEGGQILGAGVEDMKPGKGKKGRGLLVRHEGDVSELVGDEDHFVKVVDGHVIYFCSVCERSYMTLSSLKRHSNVHSWRRKYPCHFCDKVFALAEYRTKHEVWHTGERRYQCIFCWEAFATYYNLKTHQKAFHGISPGLISSEKTANGGYKQKVNALKLYRLLPMRSQKRPYKTYSDSLVNGLPSSDPSSPPLTLDCGLPGSLGPGELHSLISGSLPKGMKPDPDEFPATFPLTAGLEQGEIPTLQSSLTDVAQPRVAGKQAASLSEQGDSCGSSAKAPVSNRVKSPMINSSSELGLSSVITYGHPKPSVIVHGTAVSSVIVHSNQVTSGGGKSPLSSPSPEASNSQALPKASAKSSKKHRDSTESHRKRVRLVDGSDATEESDRKSETGRSHHKSRKGQIKSDNSSANQLSPGTEGKGAGPLCQITVRIGEEAMVKRSISETDLKRDRSPPPSKAKRTDSSPQDAKEPRHHHHHHHKHRSHRSSSIGSEGERGGDGERETGEEDSRKGNPKAPGKVREYYFRQEVRKQGESEDEEDNLWRPYYSYKPKRKAPHVHKAKKWQRKLHYKRSLRLMRRAERLMDHVNKEAEEKEENEEKMEEEKEEGEGEVKETMKLEDGGVPEGLSTSPIPSDDKDERGDDQMEEVHVKPTGPPLSPSTTSVSSMDKKRRPWSDRNVSQCDTCGRWFSSSKKRDKHELSHLLEFVCLLCRAPFPSRDELDDHQRAQHPKAPEPPSVPPQGGSQSCNEGTGIKMTAVDRARERVIVGQGSPSRLSRRSLARHTCPKCHKVCKTSSALNRHVRRHELSSSPEREREKELPEPKAVAETTVSTVSEDIDTSERVPIAQSVPVISYPIGYTEPRHNTVDMEPRQCVSQPSEVNTERQTLTLRSSPELKELCELTTPIPDREPSPQIIQPPPEVPMAAIPTASRPTPSPSSFPSSSCCSSALQGVLVMSGGAECLDYRTPMKRSLEGQSHRRTSPAPVTVPPIATPNMSLTSQMRINHTAVASSIAMTTAPLRGVCGMKREGEPADKSPRQGCGTGVLHHAGFKDSLLTQDLRVPALSRSPSPNQAQDLTMSSILARERELERERQREWERRMKRELERERDMERELERGRQREMELERALQTRGSSHSLLEHTRDMEVTLLVPKEEPISPVPSPIHTPNQTTIKSPLLHRQPSKSPRRSPTAMNLLMQANRHVAQSLHNTQGLDRFQSHTGAVNCSDRPSAHALLLPRDTSPSEEEQREDSPAPSRDPHREEVTVRGYPMQDYPLPLIVQGGYRSGKKQDENLLMSYPTGPLAFGPMGKMGPAGDLAKLPFYPDPYHLLYGPQLLAYPYNLAALPMALNMMAPGSDKVEPLPFFPALFNYAAAAGPYAGMVPQHLVANPSHYTSSSSSGKKQRDSNNGKP